MADPKDPNDTQKNAKIGHRKLTYKQKAFVREYIKNNGNGTEAVRQAYPNAESELAIRSIASENLTKPHIKAEIEAICNKAGLTPELIANELTGLITCKDDKSAKNTAIKTASEIIGLIGRPIQATQVNISLSTEGKEALKDYLE